MDLLTRRSVRARSLAAVLPVVLLTACGSGSDGSAPSASTTTQDARLSSPANASAASPSSTSSTSSSSSPTSTGPWLATTRSGTSVTATARSGRFTFTAPGAHLEVQPTAPPPAEAGAHDELIVWNETEGWLLSVATQDDVDPETLPDTLLQWCKQDLETSSDATLHDGLGTSIDDEDAMGCLVTMTYLDKPRGTYTLAVEHDAVWYLFQLRVPTTDPKVAAARRDALLRGWTWTDASVSSAPRTA